MLKRGFPRGYAAGVLSYGSLMTPIIPPGIGFILYVCQILKCPMGQYTSESMPFLIAVSAVTLLLIFVPEIVLWLPNLIFGKG